MAQVDLVPFHTPHGPSLYSESKMVLGELLKGWDGPWTGQNYINENNPIISKDLNELNRDPRLTFIGKVSFFIFVVKIRLFKTNEKISRGTVILKKLSNNAACVIWAQCFMKIGPIHVI